ncbi:MAG: amidase [Myxococcota bacterium]|jgi:amidase|nr:amidase [Myxococcota bacterium]
MSLANELARLDATAQAALVESGEATPLELVEAACARVEALNPQLNALIHPALERAVDTAKRSDLPAGPFRGVPFVMKDIGGDEAGAPYHAGMRMLKNADYVAPTDSYFTERLDAAGLVSLGRAATSELAILPAGSTLAHGNVHNPWKLGYETGGSSGGAGAVVAAGIVPMAHGSDGGGSIRIPAAHCGVVGLKPSRGRCSFGPALGERWSGLSCEFALTRTVRDSAALLDCVSGRVPGDPYSAPPPSGPFADAVTRPPGRLRIGFMNDTPREIEIHPECVRAVEQTAKLLEDLGHDVELAHPPALEEQEIVAHYVTVVAANVGRALASWGEKLGRDAVPEDVEPLTWNLAQQAQGITAPQFLATLEYVHGFGRRVSQWWEGGFDLLLTPTTAQPPPPHGVLMSSEKEPLKAYFLAAPYGVFTLPHNISGQPGISLPLHVSEDGLPIGSQLVGQIGDEEKLLAVAAQIEAAAPWSQRIPPVFAG